MNIFYGILFFIAVLLAHIICDYLRHLAGKLINHKKQWWRGLIWGAFASISVLFFVLHHPYRLFWTISSSWFMVGANYLFLFNGLYNKIRGFGWWYEGTDWEGASWVTKMFIGFGPFLSQVIQITSAIASIIIYVAFIIYK
jgi:hypothetical protein